ncbi:hypothetical protein [Devosia sp. SL43]|uniref:hypothetical protein n=1 Tax=Devosia sp. SL43 TaxID=2806348 RepID=UPI003015DE7F
MGVLGRAAARMLAGRCSLMLGTRRPMEIRDFANALPGGLLPTDYRTASRYADLCVLCIPQDAIATVLADLPHRSGRRLLIPQRAGTVAMTHPVVAAGTILVVKLEPNGPAEALAEMALQLLSTPLEPAPPVAPVALP